MTEPVPGQTPEPAVADDATTTPAPGAAATDQQPTGQQPTGQRAAEPGPAEPEPTAPDSAEPGPAGPEAAGSEPDATGPTGAGTTGAETTGAGPTAVNPQELFGSLSLSAIEADIDRLMSDKMSELDGMLAGLEELVQRLEGEITNLEPPDDGPATPRG